jgi:hypothetical protein
LPLWQSRQTASFCRPVSCWLGQNKAAAEPIALAPIVSVGFMSYAHCQLCTTYEILPYCVITGHGDGITQEQPRAACSVGGTDTIERHDVVIPTNTDTCHGDQHQIHTHVTFTSCSGDCVTVHSVEQFPDWAAPEASTSFEVRLHTVVCHALYRIMLY